MPSSTTSAAPDAVALATAPVWELRHTVTPFDAWYAALAEELDVPLATLDARLVRASGPRCPYVTPPDLDA